MTAVLKKRVAAELCQVAQSLAPPLKKFKTLDSNLNTNVPIDLNKCKTSRDVLQALTILSECYPVPMDCVTTLIDHLINYFQLETCSYLKVKILEIISRLIQYPSCDSRSMYHILKELLRKEASNSLIAHMVNIMKIAGLLNFTDNKLLTDIVHLALKVIKNDCHIVRSKCLELLGHLASNDFLVPIVHKYQPKDRTIFDDVLIAHTDDPDWRVRLSALEAILSWHYRRLSLNSSLYGHLVLLLNDSEDKIRFTVVKLLWVVAQLHPNVMVDTEDGTETMMDNCFSNLCELMTDTSIDVRAQASKSLGSMNVSISILYQTLEKKLMSNYRKKVSAHERQREMFMAGEWTSGKVSSDAPREKLNPDNMSIVSKGACGIFVYGLEDEFSRVRNACLDSLCELSCQHPAFAQQAQDFVADMLTDEIDSVRLNGVNSLHKMSSMLTVRDDQLELILGVMKDFYAYMREGAHRLLSSCHLSTTAGIKMTITSLLHNLNQYAEDKLSIWRTMKCLGDRNSVLVFAVLPPLLGLHQFFDTKEHSLDDPAYVALMILASNAVPNCPTMTSILPQYIFNHFLQLRNVYPDYIPDTKASYGTSSLSKSLSCPLSKQKKFLSTILSQLDKINFMRAIPSAYSLLKIACRDLNKVDELAPEMSACAKFVTLHLKCQIKINEFLNQTQFSLSSKCHDSVGYQIQKLSKTLTYMKTAFIGLTNAQLVEIHFLGLVVSALQLLFDFPSSSLKCKKSSCFVFSDQVARLNELLRKSNLPSTRMLSHLNTELNSPQNSEVTNYHRVLLSALRVHVSTVPLLPQIDNQMLMMKANVVEPISKSDAVNNFLPNYMLAVKMVVELENVEHIDRIRIHIKYANQTQHVNTPNISDFKTINRMNHKLVTKVMLTGTLWSEPCQVRLKVTYLAPSSLDDLPTHVASSLLDESQFVCSLSEEFIDLSDDVFVTIHPSFQKDSLF